MRSRIAVCLHKSQVVMAQFLTRRHQVDRVLECGVDRTEECGVKRAAIRAGRGADDYLQR